MAIIPIISTSPLTSGSSQEQQNAAGCVIPQGESDFYNTLLRACHRQNKQREGLCHEKTLSSHYTPVGEGVQKLLQFLS
jgi:hypothetical protein